MEGLGGREWNEGESTPGEDLGKSVPGEQAQGRRGPWCVQGTVGKPVLG